MQISLNLNLIINEVSDSQITSSRQKLADTSARGPRLASAGLHAKPLLVVAGPEWSHWGWGGRKLTEQGSWQLEPPTTTTVVQAIYPFRQLAHTVPVLEGSQRQSPGTHREKVLVNNYDVFNSTFNTMHLYYSKSDSKG